MIRGTHIRTRKSDHGMEGIIFFPGFWCYVLEPPDRDNKPNLSCIPAGEYDVKVRYSAKYGIVYWVTDVEGRTWILIHSGNFGGDRLKGLKTHTYGCLLLGLMRGVLTGQRAVLNSRIAISRFMKYMGCRPFKLTIVEAF